MEQKSLLGMLAIIFLSAILFTPQNSDIWAIPLSFGIIFGVWYFKK